MSTSGSNRAIFAALFANLGIAATKFVAFLLTSSSSMLAESIHSVADSSNQALLLLGLNTEVPTVSYRPVMFTLAPGGRGDVSIVSSLVDPLSS